MVTNYIDVPVIEITATGGCGYVSVSWAVIGNNDACPVHFYTIKLLSSTMDELYSIKTTNNKQRKFNELPFNTLFYVTVLSHNVIRALSNSFTTSVRTLDLKGMYKYNCTSIITTFCHN